MFILRAIKKFFLWLIGRSPKKRLEDVLNQTSSIIVHGVPFTIKKLGLEEYLDGSKTMIQLYNTYEKNKESCGEVPVKKIQEHYRDIFLNSIIVPKLKRKEDEAEGVFVDNLFTDWEFATELYEKIINHSFKKKIQK